MRGMPFSRPRRSAFAKQPAPRGWEFGSSSYGVSQGNSPMMAIVSLPIATLGRRSQSTTADWGIL